jgi:Uma2 family endonuclease
MLQYDRRHCLPSAEELPDSDDTPVDNEFQNLIPNFLEETLSLVWGDRQDWFFGVDMGIYYAPSRPAIVPDGFLSLGVERFIHEEGRLSYVLWDEEDIIPLFALEVISRTYGREYEEKKRLYAEIGILYYAIYIPTRRYRRNREPLEVYRLENGEYVQLPGDRVWMPEVGLAIGRDQGTHRGRTREWLYWYDELGHRLITMEEKADRAQQQADRAQQQADRAQQQAEQAQQQAEQAQQRAALLAERLRQLGVDPSEL